MRARLDAHGLVDRKRPFRDAEVAAGAEHDGGHALVRERGAKLRLPRLRAEPLRARKGIARILGRSGRLDCRSRLSRIRRRWVGRGRLSARQQERGQDRQGDDGGARAGEGRPSAPAGLRPGQGVRIRLRRFRFRRFRFRRFRFRRVRNWRWPGRDRLGPGLGLGHIERGVQLLHGAEALVLAQAHAAQQGPLLLRGDADAELAGRDELVLDHAVQRLRRHLAGQAVVDGGREGVDVRPGSLTLALILLDRRIAVLEGDGHGLVAGQGLPRAAEVQQAHRAVLEHEVIRADVAVDEALFVHGAQRAKERFDQAQQLLGLDAAALLAHQLLEGGAVQVFHDDVGGVVLLKEVADADDLGRLVHLGHGPGLGEEAEPALFEAPLHAGIGAHAEALLRPAGNERRGVILLDGDPKLQPQVAADVRDAESPFAQDAADQVAVHQRRLRRQVVRRGRVGSSGQAALGAALPGIHLRHAIWAVCLLLHGHPPFPNALFFIIPAPLQSDKRKIRVSIGHMAYKIHVVHAILRGVQAHADRFDIARLRGSAPLVYRFAEPFGQLRVVLRFGGSGSAQAAVDAELPEDRGPLGAVRAGPDVVEFRELLRADARGLHEFTPGQDFGRVGLAPGRRG